MKTKRLKILLFIVVVTAVALFAGCSIGEQTLEEFLNEKNARNQVVSYYANGGTFDGTGNLVVKDMYYVENAYVIDNFDDVNNISIARAGYVFDGWYYAELDDEGNPVFEDEAKQIVKSSGEKVDFSVRITEGEHWYVCAQWTLDVQLEFILICDSPVTGTNGTVYNPGDVIATKNFGTTGSVSVTDSSPMASSDSTYLQIYSDPECTQVFSGSVKKPTGEGAENPKVYAKYIEGVWTVVKNANQVSTMFTNSSSQGRYYIFSSEEDKVIDCSSKSLPLKSGEFNIYIEGNGCTLKGLSFAQTKISGDTTYSMFGTLGEAAAIKNLTLSDITVTMSVSSGTSSLYLFCNANNGALLDNFTIDGVSMTVSLASGLIIENIQLIGGVYDSTNWMFGGVKDDAAFIEENDVKVLNATLTVNNVIVVGEDD